MRHRTSDARSWAPSPTPASNCCTWWPARLGRRPAARRPSRLCGSLVASRRAPRRRCLCADARSRSPVRAHRARARIAYVCADSVCVSRARDTTYRGTRLHAFPMGAASDARQSESRSATRRPHDSIHSIEPLPRFALRRSPRMGVEHPSRLDGCRRASCCRCPPLGACSRAHTCGRRPVVARIRVHGRCGAAVQAAGRSARIPRRVSAGCIARDACGRRCPSAAQPALAADRIRSSGATPVSALGVEVDRISRA